MRSPIIAAKLIIAVLRLVKRPEELNRVTKIIDLLDKLKSGDDAIAVVEDIKQSPEGREALKIRPSLGNLNPADLAEKSSETLGGAYGRFMVARGLSQASFPAVRIKTDMDWILAHFYETHDLWHVLTGFDTEIPGELALQAFYLAQTRSYLPFFVISALLINTAIYSYGEKEQRLQAISDGWNLGRQAKKIFGYDWRRYLDQPLVEVKNQFGLTVSSI